MKLQGVSIVFVLIVIPLILVVTYYIQLQVDTITLQNTYDTKLLDATYDAMSSFEINTANEDLSSVSDALRTIIEASTNVFFNTLSTNLGMSNASKSYVEPYVPALLYTLYDGYYIYAPTNIPEILTDNKGNAISVGDAGVSYLTNGEYKYDENATNQYIKYSDYGGDNYKSDYGQILYLKKNTANVYTADIDGAEKRTKNVLKSYMPYSARYKGANFDIVIIYTLDNYITIEGTIGSIYYSKSGYLIPRGAVQINVGDDTTGSDIYNYSETDIQQEIERGTKITVKINSLKEEVIDGKKTYVYDDSKQDLITVAGLNKVNIEKDLTFYKNQVMATQEQLANLNSGKIATTDYNDIVTNIGEKDGATLSSANGEEIIAHCNGKINDLQYQLNQISAAVYYAKAEIFSNWVQNNLNNAASVIIKEDNLIEVSGMDNYKLEDKKDRIQQDMTEIIYDFKGSEVAIFDMNGATQYGATEIPVDCPFYNHKLNVIRNSIQYNLNLAMSTYNKNTVSTFNYAMPIMSNNEWETILSNPTIVSFMQGFNCGLKTYNNYMVVSSTNNEISISTDNIYYVKKDEFNNQDTEYHRINCKKMGENIVDQYITFSSKEAKYDKIYDKNSSLYYYDHKNLACYDCINDGNYEKNNIFDIMLSNYDDYANLRRAFYIGVGKERNNLYKMNAIKNSQGYEVIYDTTNIAEIIDNTSSKSLQNIKEIEIVFGEISLTGGDTTIKFTITDNDNKEFGTLEVGNLSLNQTTNQTRIFKIKRDLSDTTLKNQSGIRIEDLKVAPDEVKNAIKFIRVIYK